MSKNHNAIIQHSSKPYIVTNADGEEFLLPCYSETFRVLMDDKETIPSFSTVCNSTMHT